MIRLHVSDMWGCCIYPYLYADLLARWSGLLYADCRGVGIGCGPWISTYSFVMMGGGIGCSP